MALKMTSRETPFSLETASATNRISLLFIIWLPFSRSSFIFLAICPNPQCLCNDVGLFHELERKDKFIALRYQHYLVVYYVFQHTAEIAAAFKIFRQAQLDG